MTSTLPETLPFPSVHRTRLTTLQVNLGYRCNQTCSHCHVNAGPWRKEMMARELIELIPEVLARLDLHCLDLTGGAPELHPQFRELVSAARDLGVNVIDRCNLTILSEPGHEDLAEFLAAMGVRVVASLPCYEQERVDLQRGQGVYERSIAGLKKLNRLGYAQPGSPLQLDLVYNPSGPSLPPAQEPLEVQYREALASSHGIAFSHLLTITNMPIQRFARDLQHQGQLEPYQRVLREAHRPDNLNAVMCRSLISVSWTGALYDCDFNQQLNLASGSGPRQLADLLRVVDGLIDQPIAVADHCFGCTAGNGSSCGGSLS
ncbi:arsenosugar biosynthesis radical SAM (seleno)protein ArsS [Synechococcus sp. MIT S9503]|uniref:arsenosugar biosynthesis radical SAM (seleno)protein ArsS n=1 Tax=Synechococcus sp. MIT S9503 TaxID=3082547 RepID=UPI0039A627DE